MKIDTETKPNGILIIKLNGRMHLKDLHNIETTFKQLIRGQHAVVVDLHGLEALFSMGLRALILCAQSLHLRGGKLVLMSPTRNVDAVLKASGASELMPICKNWEEAEAIVAT